MLIWNTFLFADDTTSYDDDDDLSYNSLISKLCEKFGILFAWITNRNKLFLNWSKTKFMIINIKINPQEDR